jgi:hypothetical protein
MSSKIYIFRNTTFWFHFVAWLLLNLTAKTYYGNVLAEIKLFFQKQPKKGIVIFENLKKILRKKSLRTIAILFSLKNISFSVVFI